MGADLGAIRAAHCRAPKVIDDLMQRESNWLHEAAEEAEQAVEADYREFLISRKTDARSAHHDRDGTTTEPFVFGVLAEFMSMRRRFAPVVSRLPRAPSEAHRP